MTKYKKELIVEIHSHNEDHMEPPLPKEFPIKTNQEIEDVLQEELMIHKNKLAIILKERQVIWNEFEAELQKAGTLFQTLKASYPYT